MVSRRFALLGLSAAGRQSAASRHVGSWRAVSTAVPKPQPPQASSRGPLSWRALAVCLGVGTGLLGYYTIEKQRQMHGMLLHCVADDATRTAPCMAGAAADGIRFPCVIGLCLWLQN
jgi:hypothetical protein